MRILNFIFIIFLFSSLNLSFFNFAKAQSREELQAELKKLEAEIEEQRKLIQTKQTEGKSLQRDISILDTKIKKTETEIKARDRNIKNLTYDIKEKQDNIFTLSKKINKELDFAAGTINKMWTDRQNNLIYVLLSNNTLSDSVDNINNLSNLKSNLGLSIKNIKNTKTVLEGVKEKLEDNKQDEQALKQQQVAQKTEIEENKQEKNQILKETKGQEKAYQAILQDKETQAKKIRTALFALNGSNQQINFGTAYDLAKQVEAATGVRAAFLLGILTVETNLGKNVGTGNWKIDMHPTRDQPIFEQICAELGLNPDEQKVSKKAWYGYGGAMGPAQFIPSTWNSYKSRISASTGHKPPNPWNPTDAFMAAGLLLSDSGATAKTRAAEQRAAVCYLAGCGNASKAAYQFYGNDALSYADKYEANIDILKGN